MIWCGGPLECLQVATRALGRKSLAIELPDRSGLMAGIAVRHSVRADEWKTILMRIDGSERNLPPAYTVANIALSSISSAMEVGVTILAISAGVREHRLKVALLTVNTRVQSSQWKSSFVVVELRLVS
jgi:hypothetical protein